jgi:hypothetical protein
MASEIVSLRRRQLMGAGVMGAAASGSIWPALLSAAPPASSSGSLRGGDALIVSGRVVDPDDAAISGALIDVSDSGGTMTDADGRFMFTATPDAQRHRIDYRVGAAGRAPVVQTVQWPRDAAHTHALLERDESGIWRTTVAITLV